MALTNTAAPDAIAFAGHPMLVSFSSSATASAGVITIDTTSGMITSAQSLTIYTAYETIVWSPTTTPANTFELAAALETDYQISLLFIVAVGSSTTVTLTTRTTTNLALAVDASAASCDAEVTTPGGRSTSDFALCSVVINDGSSYVPSGYDKQVTLAADGSATFNIQDAFRFEFDEITSLTGFTPWRSIGTAKQYVVRHTQRQGTTVEPFGELSARVAVYGRTSNNFLGEPLDSLTFQTLAPRRRYMSKAAPIYLTWANVQTVTSAQLLISCTAADGTGTLVSKAITLPSINQVWNYPCGYDQLDLDSETGSPFVQWAVSMRYVAGGVTYNSEAMTFLVDDNLYDTETILLAYNSRGGVDTFRLLGDLEASTEHTSSDRVDYEADGRVLASKYDPQTTHRYTANTGYLDTLGAMQHFDELLASERVFWYVDGLLEQVYIETVELQKGSLSANLYSAAIEFRLAANDLAPRTENLTP